MTRLIYFFVILSLVSAGGCSKKEPPPSRPAAAPAVVMPAVLPQLEQNKMAQANSTAKSSVPDYSFRPVPDELETPSAEQAKDLPPTID